MTASKLLERLNLRAANIALTVLILFGAVALWLAYQCHPPLTINIGEPDRPLVANFNDPEPSFRNRTNPAFKWDGISYRWSKSTSQLVFPLLGDAPYRLTLRYAYGTNPQPRLELTSGIKPLTTLPATAPDEKGWQTQQFELPANSSVEGTVTVTLKTNGFVPSQVGQGSDPRELGVLVDNISLEYAGKSFANLPPPALWINFALAVGLIFYLLQGGGFSLLWASASTVVATALVVGWLATNFFSLSPLLNTEFVLPLSVVTVLVWLIRLGLPRLLGWLNLPLTKRDAGILALIFAALFILLYFGQRNPYFASSDTGLAVRHLQTVLNGRLVFAEFLPDFKTLSPYPPAYYLLLAPLTWFGGTERSTLIFLVESVNAALFASSIILVYILVRCLLQPITASNNLKISEKSTTAILAAAFYATVRYPLVIFSQGNHANLFATWLFTLWLAGLCLLIRLPLPLDKPTTWATRWGWLLLGAVTVGLQLAHFGVVLFASVVVGVAVVGLVLLDWVRYGLYLAILWGSATLVSFGLYYWQQLDVIGKQFNRAGASKPLDLLEAGRGFYADLRDDFGLLLAFALAGSFLLWLLSQFAKADSLKKMSFLKEKINPPGVLLLAITVASLVFVVLEQVQGLPTRYQLYFAPALAVFGALWWGWLWRRGWSGKLLVIGIGLVQVLAVISVWVERTSYYYLR